MRPAARRRRAWPGSSAAPRSANRCESAAPWPGSPRARAAHPPARCGRSRRHSCITESIAGSRSGSSRMLLQQAEQVGVPAELGLVHPREFALVEQGDGDVADRAGRRCDGRRHRAVARNMGGVDDVEVVEPRLENRKHRVTEGRKLSQQALRRGVGTVSEHRCAPAERRRGGDPALAQQRDGRRALPADLDLGVLQRLAEGEERQRVAVRVEERIAEPREGIALRDLDCLRAGMKSSTRSRSSRA